MRPCISVVIVNWNSGRLLDRCLNSFGNVSSDAVELDSITIVDNASTDNSLAGIERLHNQLPLRVVRNQENRGFAAACNQGARACGSEFLLFLNPDTRLSAGSLRVPAAFLAAPENRGVGIVGIRLHDAHGEPARSVSRRPSARLLTGTCLGLDRLLPGIFPSLLLPPVPHLGAQEVDQVTGAFFFIRRALFDALGGFDERFFVYFEDADLALRAHARGMSSVFLGSASAEHVGQGSSGAIMGPRLFYFCRSRIAFARKHFGRGGSAAVCVATLLVEPLLRAARALARGSIAEMGAVSRGYAMLWSDMLGLRQAGSSQ